MTRATEFRVDALELEMLPVFKDTELGVFRDRK
jgi:hypothetical protein